MNPKPEPFRPQAEPAPPAPFSADLLPAAEVSAEILAVYAEWCASRADSTRPAPRPEHDARALTDGGTEARITLDGTAYVLRITRAGKLILTK